MLKSIILITSDSSLEAAIKASCPPPMSVRVFSKDGLVNARHLISEHGRTIVESSDNADAVLVDWSFEDAPAINTLCYHIRKDQLAPVVAITGGGPETMTACLAAGTDSALLLPLSLPYLEAIAMSYRRLLDAASASHSAIGATSSKSGSGAIGTPTGGVDLEVAELTARNLKLDLLAHRCFVSGREIELTPREFALLHYLISRTGELCTRDDILKSVWGIDFDTGTNMVDVYMHYVRRKLEAHGLEGMLQTVRGLGYRLDTLP